MAIRTYDILLDSYNSTMPEPIVGRQGDKNGAVTLHVTITDRGTAVDLTGQTVSLIAETAKGTAVVADNAGVTLTDVTNGKFDYAIPNALWSEAGKIKKAYFSLNDAGGQQATYDLIFIVKKAIDVSQKTADDYITIIDGTLKSLNEKIDAIAVPETFTDLAAIKSKYPNGSNGIKIAADNGHKYIWANGTWTDAGVYQSVGVGDNSVDFNNIKQPLTRAAIILGTITINEINKTISTTSNLALDINYYYEYPNQAVTLAIPDIDGPIYFYYDRVSKDYKIKAYNDHSWSLTNSNVLIGILYLHRFITFGSESKYHVDYADQQTRPVRDSAEILYGRLAVDYTNNQIIKQTNTIIINSRGISTSINYSQPLDLPVDTDLQVVQVFYDAVAKSLFAIAGYYYKADKQIYLFSIYKGHIYDADEKHFSFIDRNRIEDKQAETQMMMISPNDTIKITENWNNDHGDGTAIFPAGLNLYLNANGMFQNIGSGFTVNFSYDQAKIIQTGIGILSFFYSIDSKSIYANYFKQAGNDIKLFSLYHGKVYGSNVQAYIVNGVDDGGWGSAPSKQKLNLMDWYQKAKNGDSANIIWLGDSTWEGYRVVDKNNVFPVYLNSLLPNEFNGVDSFNCSKGGYSTKQLYNNFDTLTANATNVGLLMIGGGLNDYANIADSKKYLDLLVQKARDNSWTPVIVTTQATALLYADTAVGGDWTRTQTDFAKINKMKRQYAHDNDIDLLDFEKYTHDFIDKSPTLMSEMFTDYLHGQDPIHIFEANVAMAYLSQPADVISENQLVGITTINARSNVSYNLAYTPLSIMEDGFKIKYAFTASGDEVLLDYQFLITADGSSWSLNGFNHGVPVRVTVDGTDYMLSVDGQICSLPIGYHHVVAKSTAGTVDFKGLKIEKDNR